MRVVVDPGVFVSAVISPLGAPAELWQAVRAREVELVVSPHLLAELSGVLARDKFRRSLSLDEVRRFIAEITDLADSHSDPTVDTSITRDPNDDYLVALARAAAAEAIVSGDADLTDHRDLEPPVLTPREALERLQEGRMRTDE